MKVFFISFFILISVSAISQEINNLNEIKPDNEYENVLVKKLDTDSNSTSFVIWIKKGVKSHKHEAHSEIISVIEGEGVMSINNNSFDIKAGDYFRIPRNIFHSLRVLSTEPMKVLSVQSPEFLGKDRFFEEGNN